MKLRQDTKFLRATVSQEIREILSQDTMDPNGIRTVQVMVPMSPQVFVTADADAAAAFGLNRFYRMPPAAPGTTLKFDLRAGQRLWAAARSGMATLTLVVEYPAS